MLPPVEYRIVRYLNLLGGRSLDRATELLCAFWVLCALWSVLTLAAVILDRKRRVQVAVTVVLALALHFAISEGLLKHAALTLVAQRVRPWIAHPDLVAVGVRFRDSSFPSSHMASSAAVLTALVAYYRKMWPVALLFILAMGIARMHCAMHYPTDVLAGTALGIGYGALAVLIVRRAGRPGVRPDTRTASM